MNTRVPRSTKVLVSGVRAKHDAIPEVMAPLLDAMGHLSLEAQRVFAVISQCQKNGESACWFAPFVLTRVLTLCHSRCAAHSPHAELQEGDVEATKKASFARLEVRVVWNWIHLHLTLGSPLTRRLLLHLRCSSRQTSIS